MNRTSNTEAIELLSTPGARLESFSFNVPTNHTQGVGYPTMFKALEVAIERMQNRVEEHNNWYGENKPKTEHVPLPETITIDLRWQIRREDGALLDVLSARYTFNNIAEAYVHLESGKENFS